LTKSLASTKYIRIFRYKTKVMIILSIMLFIIVSHYVGQFICWVNNDKRLPLFVGGLFFTKVALALGGLLIISYLFNELIK